MADIPDTRASLLVRLRRPADHDAWADFVRLYGPVAFAYFRRRGLQEADAIDLAQDLFADLAARLPTFDYDPGRGRFHAWLFTQARWRLLHFLRARRRDPVQLPDAADDEPPAATDELAWRREARARLVEIALEDVRPTVNATTFEAFHRTAILGQAGEAVADALGLTRAAVYLARARVLAKLRESVARLDPDALDPDALDRPDQDARPTLAAGKDPR